MAQSDLGPSGVVDACGLTCSAPLFGQTRLTRALLPTTSFACSTRTMRRSMLRAPSGRTFGKSVSDREFERAEAHHFAALIAHGIFSSMPVLEMSSPGISRSRRQLAGLWLKACLNSLHRCA